MKNSTIFAKTLNPKLMEAESRRGKNVFSRIFYFYIDGFRAMTLGKTLWAIILIKLFIFFFVLKIFFFPDFLGSRCDTDTECADYVATELTTILPK